MTAYGALISLRNTIHNILRSYSRTPFHTTLETAYAELDPLQEILERLDGSSKSKSRKKVNALDSRIKQKLWDFEDLLENLLSDGMNRGRVLYESSLPQIHPLQKLQEDSFLTHVPRLHDAADSLIRSIRDMKEEYMYELGNMPQDDKDEDEDEAAVISSTSTGSKMVGLSDEFAEVKYVLYNYRGPSFMSYTIVGMAGLGKTTLARKIYEDPEIQSYFDCRIWIRVGRKYEFDQVSRDTLAARMQGGERCLIVLDDVWETGVLPIIFISLMDMEDRLIRILITARGRNVIRDFQMPNEQVDTSVRVNTNKVLRLLDEEESKDLLCVKVFGEEEICPTELDKAAAKIAKNCEGLPLMILTVAKRLSNNRDPDYWIDVAEERNSVFTDSYEEISKVLYPSYDYLPQRFKMPFLFMGVFPRNYDIPMSKILNLMVAEGWLPSPNAYQTLNDLATEYLDELCMSYSLVLFKPKSSDWFLADSYDVLKTCRLHSSWRHLCRREARKNKFFHVLNRLVDASPRSLEDGEQEEVDIVIKGQRGLCLENNLLFGLKEFCNSVEYYCASTARSLLFFGPYHQYPTPLVDFKLLRELDALQLRFYTFPTQILTLFQLRYLALTCNDHLPSTISKLSKLQTLIIHPHHNIIKCHTPPPSIPIEIWDMAKIEHIEILGKSLITTSDQANTYLWNLKTLVGVNVDIGTISEFSKRIPFLNKLGVQMELTPYADTNISTDLILSCFKSISTLVYLRTLKCIIKNPVHVPLARCPVPAPRSLMLPQFLVKLHLSGMGFPFEHMMDVVASLPYLQVMKLRSYAFRGPKWKIPDGSFLELKYLAIEDSDLVDWKPPSGSFPKLNHISLKHCYKLRELEWSPDVGFARIELVDCNPLAVTCAKKLQPKHKNCIKVFASDTYHS